MAFRSWIGSQGGHDATAWTKLHVTASLVHSDDAEEGAALQAGLAARKRRSALADSARDTGWESTLEERVTAAGGTAGAWRRSAGSSGTRWPGAGTFQSAGREASAGRRRLQPLRALQAGRPAHGAERRSICSAPMECTVQRSDAAQVMRRAAYNSGRRGEAGGRTAQARATQRQ
ncbi:hypothetical protein FGB62_246g03 [Gracilaria domingensis]|nr:hypothetical protein FGB62_246g03 [Gracilaria domingensis]